MARQSFQLHQPARLRLHVKELPRELPVRHPALLPPGSEVRFEPPGQPERILGPRVGRHLDGPDSETRGIGPRRRQPRLSHSRQNVG